MDRNEILALYIDKESRGLEIGPAHAPVFPKREGYNVKILDMVSTDELRAKMSSHGLDTSRIEEVDFVWDGRPYREIVGDGISFNWIVASHVIEHVPDLIGFLQDVHDVLEDGGLLLLVIPDKRYCFDYFRERSSIASVIDAHVDRHTQYTLGNLQEFLLYYCKNNGNISWNPNIRGDITLTHELNVARNTVVVEKDLGIHTWCFTPYHFRLMMHDLYCLGYIDFVERGFHEPGGFEFVVVMKKADGDTSDRSPHVDRLSFLRRGKREATPELSLGEICLLLGAQVLRRTVSTAHGIMRNVPGARTTYRSIKSIVAQLNR